MATGNDRSNASAGVVQAAEPVQAFLVQAADFGLLSPLPEVKAHLPGLTAYPIQDEQGDPRSTFIAFARSDAQPAAGDAAVALDEPFRALFESIDEGVATVEVVFDEDDRAVDYRFLAVNRAYHAVSGISGEVVGKRISEVMPDIDPSVIQRIGKVALNGEPSRFEDFIRPLHRWFEIYLSRFGGPGSRTVVAVFRDITERKQRERLQIFLLTLSDALRPLVDPQEIQVLAADLLGDHLQVNQANYGEVLGENVHISHSYAIGLPPMVGSFRHDDFGKNLMDGHRTGRLQICSNTTSDPLFDEQERKALAAAHVGAYIAVPLVKAGVWVGALSVLNIQPRDWAPTEVQAVQEVAERTWAAVERARSEVALSRSEEKYRSLFESIDEGVSTIEVYFDEHEKAVDYKVLEINAAHEAISGLGREIIGKNIRELMPDVPKNLLERVGHVALTGQPIRFEEFVSGLDRWFDIYLVRDGGSDSRRVVSVSKNITERKRREHHAAFLDKLSQALVLLDSPEQIVRATGEALGAHLDVSFVHLVDVELSPGDEPAEACFTVLATWEREGVVIASGAYRAGDFLSEEFLRAARAGETVVICDTDNDPRVDRQAYSAIGMRGFVAVPILKDDAWPALIAVCTPRPRDWRLDEITLIVDVAHRVFPLCERKRAEEALLSSTARASKLQRRLIEVEESERRMIHRELHDRIGQDLATVKLNIELACSVPPAEVGKRLKAALEVVQSAIKTSRDLMSELRPPGLDDHGLGVALKIFAGTLEDRLPIAVRIRGVDLELRLPHPIEASLFRIAQEAINNVAKYANARTVEISFVQKLQEVHLMIADDGCGFEATQLLEPSGYGLQIMRERAEAVDAELKVDSSPGRGTRISVILECTA